MKGFIIIGIIIVLLLLSFVIGKIIYFTRIIEPKSMAEQNIPWSYYACEAIICVILLILLLYEFKL